MDWKEYSERKSECVSAATKVIAERNTNAGVSLETWQKLLNATKAMLAFHGDPRDDAAVVEKAREWETHVREQINKKLQEEFLDLLKQMPAIKDRGDKKEMSEFCMKYMFLALKLNGAARLQGFDELWAHHYAAA
jgi:hypothetical protein